MSCRQYLILRQFDYLCRMHAQKMDEVFASYDLLVSLSRHSDIIISYADVLRVGFQLAFNKWGRHSLCALRTWDQSKNCVFKQISMSRLWHLFQILSCTMLCSGRNICLSELVTMQTIVEDGGREQAAFEAANPLPLSFVEGQHGDFATFISSGCDFVEVSPLVHHSGTVQQSQQSLPCSSTCLCSAS